MNSNDETKQIINLNNCIMKQFTLKSLMLLLLLLIGGGSYAWGEDFVKVTSAPDSWEGSYLFVYETGNVCFDGSLTNLDVVRNTKKVTIKDGVIAATDELKACCFTVTADSQNKGWYQIKSASKFYIAGTVKTNKKSNGLASTDQEAKASNYLNRFEFDGKAVSVYSQSNDGETVLRFNKAKDQQRFRYFKSGQEPIALYKLSSTATLISIAVSGTPTKTTYEEGEAFDPTGLVVTGTYDDGTKKEITDGIVWVKDPEILKLGTTSVDVYASVGNIDSDVYTVEGITVKEKATLIGIEANGTPDDFWKGDKFNKNGITVTALWSDGSESDVTEQCQFTEPDMTTAGKKTVTVTYENKTCTYDIEVKTIENTKETAYTVSKAIALIKAGKDLATQVYVKGVVSEIVTKYNPDFGNVSFNVSVDGSVEGEQFQFYRTQKDAENTYTEDPKIEVGATVVGYGTLFLYKDNYEFAAGNYLVEYNAPVEKVLKSIAISGEATKTTYKEGEAFDPTGLVVTATYDDESTKVVTDDVTWTFDPATLILGTTEVNVTATYGEKTASKTVAVTVTEVQKYNVTWNVNGKVYTEGAPTTEVVEGEKLGTLPTAPASIGGLVFMGWTNEAVTSQEAAPAVLFTSAADAPAVTADVTYYAVFAAQAGAGWARVTALSDITEGSYVIKNDGFILPNSNTNKSPQKVTAPSITDNVITGEVDESMVWQFVSTGASNQFYIKNAAGDYLYVIDKSQGIRVADTDTPDKWTFEENGEGYFSMKDANSNRYCATYKAGEDWRSYNSKDYGNYANGGKLELYRNDISYSNYTTTVETNSLTLRAFDGKNYFATFSCDKAVKFVDATVFTVDVENGTISLNEIASKQVPANTGVLLRSAKESDVFTYIESAPAIEGTNLLKPASEQMTEGFKFYKLAYDNYTEKTGLGFYWGAENGGAYTVKPGLAYLAVPEEQAANVKGFSFDGTQTGINGVEATTAKGAIYNLNGQRVEKAQRGIYIQNGKKFIVK